MEYRGQYYELTTIDDPQLGDLIVHNGNVELVITEETDILQDEIFPMIQNFGCKLYKPE